MSDKAKLRVKDEIKGNLKDIKHANNSKQIISAIEKYNSTLIGVHNYYNKATFISIDMSYISRKVYNLKRKTLKETIVFQVPNYLNNGFIENTYGKSKQLSSIYGMNIVPINYVQYKKQQCLQVYQNRKK